MESFYIPGDGIKRDPERENSALPPIASRPANSIHIRVTFNAVTRYKYYFWAANTVYSIP